MLDIDHLGTMLIIIPLLLIAARFARQTQIFASATCGGKYTNRFAIISALLPGQVAQAKTLNCLRIVRVCLRQNILL
jgi:hypothetical protein